MGGRFSPIVIVILLVIVVVIGLVIRNIVAVDTTNPNKPGSKTEKNLISPVLNFEKELNNGKVTIKVTAQTKDEMGIDSIILPSGSKINGSEATYEVEENGKYTFKAVGVNGAETEEEVEVSEIEEASAINPYIPEGFKVVGGDVQSGLVISDDYDNQYVWVPVPSGSLTRTTIFDTNYEESDSAAQNLNNSVAKYYGFYIGRFEASEYEIGEEKTAATMAGKIPWTNINCVDAMEYATSAKKAFGYGEDIQTALLTGSAWDTTIEWIEEEYEGYTSSNEYGNFDGMIYPTGQIQKDMLKNICDLSGNVREWTTEKYIDRNATTSTKKSKNSKNGGTEQIVYRIIRGGSASLNRTPKSRIRYDETTSDLYWGFRTILFKQ